MWISKLFCTIMTSQRENLTVLVIGLGSCVFVRMLKTKIYTLLIPSPMAFILDSCTVALETRMDFKVVLYLYDITESKTDSTSICVRVLCQC